MNNILKLSIAASALTVVSMSANASISEKKQVLQTAKNYATSIACSTTFERDSEDFKTSLRDVYKIDNGENTSMSYDLGGRSYVVHWAGDEGCLGGSGTYSHYLTLITRMTDTRPFLVDRSTPDILTAVNEDDYIINSRFIESIKVKNDVIDIVSYTFDDNDCNNCASLKYRYKVRYEDEPHYGWSLISQKFLGKKASNYN